MNDFFFFFFFGNERIIFGEKVGNGVIIIDVVVVFFHFDSEDFVEVVDEVAGNGDVFGGVDFVAGEDPHFDSAHTDFFDGFGDVVLEFVFDDGGAEESQVIFDFVVALFDEFVFVGQIHFAVFEVPVPFHVEVFFDEFIRDHQRSKSFLRKLVDFVFDVFFYFGLFHVVVQSVFYFAVGAFAVENNFVVFGVF